MTDVDCVLFAHARYKYAPCIPGVGRAFSTEY